jgi:GMP synthase (glutamine-hydrolysing)
MNILIVDGNEKKSSDNYVQLGMDTQYDVYSKILQELAKDALSITVIHPAINSDYIPQGVSLDDFDGIAWTGSLLNIYESTPPIIRQIELAKKLLNKKNSIFGSCWGLQVLVTAAGGKIRKNPNGLEAIIANNINLNEEGVKHPMYYGKSKTFSSFCFHYDDTEILPENTTILASNENSKIQAISFTNKNSKVWAVQYHPEFDPVWMSGLMDQREKILLDEGIYNNQEEFESYKNYFSNIEKFEGQKIPLNISNNLINRKMHTLELSNWLNSLKNQA